MLIMKFAFPFSKNITALSASMALALTLSSSVTFAQGSLTPSGAPAPTFKTLQQIEPRTPISSLPITINTSGSYYITSNLTGTAGTIGISLAADNITLDLGGFTLFGGGGNIAVSQSGGSRTNLVIRNGVIRGWTNGAVHVGSFHVQCEDLNLVDNGGAGILTSGYATVRRCLVSGALSSSLAGIYCGSGSLVQDCITRSNAGVGIYTGPRTRVMDCVAEGNAKTGIYANEGSTVSHCNSANNGAHGIQGTTGVTVIGCSVQTNATDGFILGSAGTIVNCTSSFNTEDGITVGNNSTVTSCTTMTNSDIGIVAGTGSTIIGCTVSGNPFDGISASGNCTIKDCTVTGNRRGIVAAGSINGCTVYGNSLSGILISGNNSRAADNHCDLNGSGGTDAGILINARFCIIEGNTVMSNNTFGIRSALGTNFVARNIARGNVTSFSFSTGDVFGPTNATPAGVITNTSPWANFSF
jgi:parallel beta-helix repeat protein